MAYYAYWKHSFESSRSLGVCFTYCLKVDYLNFSSLAVTMLKYGGSLKRVRQVGLKSDFAISPEFARIRVFGAFAAGLR
jgi:hypothetical protein